MTYKSRKLHGIVWGSLWGERMRRSPWTWGSAFIGVESGGLGFQNVHSLLVTLKYEWLFKGENRKSLNKTKIKKPQRLTNLTKTSEKKKKRLTGEQRWEVQLILQVSGWQSVYWRKDVRNQQLPRLRLSVQPHLPSPADFVQLTLNLGTEWIFTLSNTTWSNFWLYIR